MKIPIKFLIMFGFVVVFLSPSPSSFPGFGFLRDVNAEITEPYEWTRTQKGTASSHDVESQSTARDSTNNIYTAGLFSGTVDFDGTAGTDNHTSSSGDSAFVSKYSASGTYEWTRIVDGQSAVIAVTVDGGDNVYITGNYSGTKDLDGTAGVDNHTSAGGVDAFLTKYASNGDYEWSRTFDGASTVQGHAVITDSNDDVYVQSLFSGTTDFDGTAGTDNHISNGFGDIALSKYTGTGTYEWTRAFGGTAGELRGGLDVDSSNNVYLTGGFRNTVDFDGTAGTDNHSSNGFDDIFITQYASNGDYGWTRTFGSTSVEIGRAVVVDSGNNVYITGTFGDTTDFDGTAGTDSHTIIGFDDIFITKYASNGDYGWTRTVGSSSDSGSGYAIAIDSSDSIYVAGNFEGTVDFDGTAGTDNHSSNGGPDAFLTSYSGSGSYKWSRTLGGSGDEDYGDYARGVVVDSNENVYSVGWFAGTNVDFNGTAGTDLYSSPTTSASTGFIKKNKPSEYQVSNLPASLDAEDVSSQDLEDGSSTGSVSSTEIIRLKDNSTGLVLADISTDFSAGTDRDWSSVTGDSSLATGIAFVHNLVSAPGTAASYTLYIPRINGATGAHVCPGATSLAASIPGCAAGYDVTIGDSGVTLVVIDSQEYIAVSGLTGTGGFGTGAENASVYIDLDAQPATAPSTISTAPEVAVSTSDSFYLSYIPSTTEFAASDTVDIAIPFDWSGLAVCAATGDADGAGGNDHTVAVVDTQIIRYTFTGVTTTALATGVEFCFTATTVGTPGNYNIPFSDTNDGDYGPALIYVGDDNDVTLTATIPITLSLRIKEPTTTTDTNVCALGVLNPGSVNSCSYRIAAGTNISTGLQVFTFADNQLNTAGDSADIDDVAGGGTVTAGVEEHGVLVTLGTGWTVGGSFSSTTDEVMPLIETLILDAAASISDSVEANWSTITHSASVNSGTSGGSYDQLVTYRAWVDT